MVGALRGSFFVPLRLPVVPPTPWSPPRGAPRLTRCCLVGCVFPFFGCKGVDLIRFRYGQLSSPFLLRRFPSASRTGDTNHIL